ncbi:MAG TPA: sigma-70 family RNA polymerase sigma factor [Verrucomicrobiae bacterium]|nr:sigma-70 family RNA polymerase sigma factor [Verrucomicrobiae bacterium]
MNEHELLHAYVEAGSEAAFTELTARYTDLVYSSAMRQVQSPQLAEEVTQSVFLALACKASRLRREVVLSGWLLRATRYLAMDIQKAEWRRQKREQIAAAMAEPVRLPEEAPVWQSALPILDEALDRLRQCDRQALALRFFEKKGFDEVGRILGISEDAAKKRVGRAVERLRRGLLRRKVILSALALTGGLAAESVKAAPVWLAARAARTALSSVAAAEAAGLGSWLAGTWHKSLSQGVAWCVVALLIPCAWQSARLASARAEESRLEAMLATLAGQQADLAREQVQVQRRLRRASNNLARLEKPLTLASGLMASSGFTNLDPRLFHWDEAADYVRLPKAVMRWVSFDAKDSRPGVGSGPDPAPALDRETGEVSSALMGALGLSQAEQDTLNSFCRSSLTAWHGFSASRSFLTNAQALDFAHQEYVPLNADSRAWLAPALSEEGGVWRKQLEESLAGFVGAERARILLQQATDDGSTGQCFDGFGTQQVIWAVTPLTNGNVYLCFRRTVDGNLVRGSTGTEVPLTAALSPYYPGWRSDPNGRMNGHPVWTAFHQPVPEALTTYLRQWQAERATADDEPQSPSDAGNERQ